MQRGITYHFPQETPEELYIGGIQITMAGGRGRMLPEITCSDDPSTCQPVGPGRLYAEVHRVRSTHGLSLALCRSGRKEGAW